ncbi:hypothetical protein B9G55_01475 [Saccharibacillus sp. O16]|nr:hypothetical protein B9G55_01475 [Saccharibacillus sp. O16]
MGVVTVTAKLIRVGQVSAVDPEAGAARVTFPDLDEVVSGWLPVIGYGRTWARTYALPAAGDMVAVIFLSAGVQDGFVLGNYQVLDEDVDVTDDQFGVWFEDGSRVYYDRAAGELVVESTGSIRAVATDVRVTATGTAKLAAPTIILDAQTVRVTGNLAAAGTVTGSNL